MVCAVEKKACAAGNRTEFSDNQAVAVDRIVIKHIVLFKIAGIVDEIVVDRVVTDFDVRASDHIFQVNRLPCIIK